MIAGEPVEQTAVDVEADAEAEHPGPDPAGLAGVGSDLQLVSLAHRWQSVGEKQDVVGSLPVDQHAQCRGQRSVNVGTASGEQAVDESQGGLL